MLGQYHGRLQIGWVLWRFRRGILRRRHGRIGRCARGKLNGRGCSEAVGMYSSVSIWSRRQKWDSYARAGLVWTSACGTTVLGHDGSSLRPLSLLTGRNAASPSIQQPPLPHHHLHTAALLPSPFCHSLLFCPVGLELCLPCNTHPDSHGCLA